MREAREIFCKLSKREQEVSMLVALGKTAKEAAQVLNISPRTVERFRDSARAKLGVESKSELVSIVLKTAKAESILCLLSTKKMAESQ